MDTFSATPFCYATFVWQTPVIRWWTCISPETVECFLCACDLQGWTQASKLSSFPLLKDNLGDISCPHVLTLHGSPGHPQQSADHGASAVGPMGKPIRLLAKAWHSHMANRRAATKPCMFYAFRLYLLVSGFASLV